jgi:D-methionine transport system permease protein
MDMRDLLLTATLETITLVGVSACIGLIFGLPIALMLYLYRPCGIKQNLFVYTILGSTVNAFRSIPYIILIVLLIPFTRFLVGSSIGLWSAAVPLSIASFLLIARVGEEAFLTVPKELIETGHAMGATLRQIITKILIPEAFPRLVGGTTTTIINLIGFSAMAGAVGGGGLGDLGIRYGYQRYDLFVLAIIVVILVFFVQAVQMLGDYLVRIMTK